MADMTKQRFWKVQCAYPTPIRHGNGTDSGRTYMATHSLGVTARTATEAIERVMAARPEAIIWAVTHTGLIDLPTPADAGEDE